MPPLNTKDRNKYLDKILAPAFLLYFVLWAHGCYLSDNIEAVHEQVLQIEKNLKQGPQGQTIEKNLAVLKSELQNIIVPEMVVIEIEWKFKGRKFTSEAIAWPKGSIVYDNIGTFVLGRTDKVEM